MCIIKLNNLQIKYGKKVVVDNISFEIKKAEIVAIAGPSGRGKSSLLYTIGMLHDDFNGDFSILENNNPKMNSKIGKNLLKQDISFIFQNYALIDNKTVKENLELAKKIATSRIDVKEALKEVGLEDKIDSKILELSGGEQQRVALARTILKKSKILLADEPTGSLDKKNRDIVLDFFEKNRKENETTILIVTHDDEVIKRCDRVIYL